MADLRVAHLAIGKADVAALGGELGVGETGPEAIEDGRIRERYRIARARLGQPPTVEDDEGERGNRHAALTIAANSVGSRLAPPTRAPSMSGCAISSAAFAGLTEPP